MIDTVIDRRLEIRTYISNSPNSIVNRQCNLKLDRRHEETLHHKRDTKAYRHMGRYSTLFFGKMSTKFWWAIIFHVLKYPTLEDISKHL